MGERTQRQNITGRLAFCVECTAQVQKLEDIWLGKFDPFFSYHPSYKKLILWSVRSVLEAVRKNQRWSLPYIWLCPKIQPFWNKTCTYIGKTLGHSIPNDVKTFYFYVLNENVVAWNDINLCETLLLACKRSYNKTDLPSSIFLLLILYGK